MLSLADATQLESLEDKAVSRFRPWWEVLTFYSLNGLLMAVLFALAGVTISGTYEIWCFPLGNDTALDSSTVYYANARCSRIFEGRYLIYFPYGMFLEWAVFFAVHLLWFKLPTTLFLFQEISEVFSEFSSIKPVEYNSEKRKSRGVSGLSSKLTGLQLNMNKETTEKIRNLVGRLKQILKRNNKMFWLYGVKAVFLSVSNGIVVVLLAVWLSERQWHASFFCDMTLHIPSIYKDMTCSLPAAPFLYGLMICNIIFAFSICLCNVRAIVWLCTFNYETYKHYKKAFGKWPFLLEKPGFDDFCFCLSLTSFTSKDGMILGDTIYSSLKVYQRSEKQINAEPMQEVNFKPKFSSMFYQGEMIAHNLGLKVLETAVSDDSLLRAIARTVRMEKPTVCQGIAQELMTNISVYKDLVDNDLNCPVFEDCVELLQSERKCPKEFHHYALMAACNAFYINIVVLGPGSECWSYKASDGLNKALSKYLLFIRPNYYTATEDDPEAEDNQNNRNLFISDPSYRTQLLEKALFSWNEEGQEQYKGTVKKLKPRVISYGATTSQEPKRPTNVLSDLFAEMGHKISKHILSRSYIRSVQTYNQDEGSKS